MGKQETLCPAAAPEGPDPESSAVAALAAGGGGRWRRRSGKPRGKQPCPRRSPELVQVAVSVCVSLSHVAEASRQGLRGCCMLLFQPSLGLCRDAPRESTSCPGAGGCRVPVRKYCGWLRARRSVGLRRATSVRLSEE